MKNGRSTSQESRCKCALQGIFSCRLKSICESVSNAPVYERPDVFLPSGFKRAEVRMHQISVFHHVYGPRGHFIERNFACLPRYVQRYSRASGVLFFFISLSFFSFLLTCHQYSLNKSKQKKDNNDGIGMFLINICNSIVGWNSAKLSHIL